MSKNFNDTIYSLESIQSHMNGVRNHANLNLDFLKLHQEIINLQRVALYILIQLKQFEIY